MQAQVGEWLVIEGKTLDDRRRQGQIVALVHTDGSPPYHVRWMEDNHESLVYPGPGARIEAEPVPPAAQSLG